MGEMKALTSRLIASWDKGLARNASDRLYLGAKAFALLQIPADWVPPFIVLTASFAEAWTSEGSSLTLFSTLRNQESQLLDSFITTAQSYSAGRGARVIARSNTPNESILERGTHDSLLCEPTVAELSATVDRILAHAPVRNMPVLIQICIEPNVSGHLSNERHLTPSQNLWIVETDAFTLPDVKRTRFRVEPKPNSAGVLIARTERGLVAGLRRVAAWFLQASGGCCHIEWVWDSRNLWIVQLDRAVIPETSPAFLEYGDQSKKAVPQALENYMVLRTFADFDTGFLSKLDAPLLFRRLGLPTGNLLVLDREMWFESKKQGHQLLRTDLDAMCSVSVIIRVDLVAHSADQSLLLPRSHASRDSTYLIDFMEQVSSQFDTDEARGIGWAFILASTVPAMASALVQASPHGGPIRVDSLWGLPDGLLFYSHDTAIIDLGKDRVSYKTRYKDLAIVPVEEEWKRVSIGPPLDWQKVLSRDEVRVLGTWAVEVAEDVGHPIQLMVLCRIRGLRGAPGCLPWHFTSIPSSDLSGRMSLPQEGKSAVPIASRADLERFKRAPSDVHIRGLVLRPEIGLTRDKEFLREVGALAHSHQIPIHFHGSLLGHAYYILKSTGAIAYPVSTIQDDPKIRKYHKLVRDQIPAIVQRAGGIARVKSVSSDRSKRLLAQKIVEEAFEVWEAEGAELVDEIADLLEVIDALVKVHEIPESALRRTRRDRLRQRGGFERLLFLEETVFSDLQNLEETAGELPVQFDSGTSHALPRLRSRPPSRVHTSGDGKDRVKITVSLVPPADREALESGRVTLEGHVFELDLRYEHGYLIMHLRRATPIVAPDQLTLFDDD